MSEHSNGQHPYNVEMSEQTKKILLQRHREAALEGKSSQFLAAFRIILHRLHNDPLTFGEHIYRLPALRLLVRQGMVSPLLVYYAVHEDLPLVFIRGFKVLS